MGDAILTLNARSLLQPTGRMIAAHASASIRAGSDQVSTR